MNRLDLLKMSLWGVLAVLAHRVFRISEAHLGRESDMLDKAQEVLIIGGGPAGLSAAMSLGRMRRKVLICDDGKPRNAASKHMNNFVSLDGLDPSLWRAQARQSLEKYPTVNFYYGRVLKVEKKGSGFLAHLNSGEIFEFRKLILAYGVKDDLDHIEGIRELWGKLVFHCPYCHGYEVRNKKIGLMAYSPFAEHMLPMLSGLSAHLVLFMEDADKLSADFLNVLQKKNIQLVKEKIVKLESSKKDVLSVNLKDGSTINCDGLFVAARMPFQMSSSMGEDLGCAKTELGFFGVDVLGKTSVSGVFAAGDIVSPMHSVLNSAAQGQAAGAGAGSEILHEDFLKI